MPKKTAIRINERTLDLVTFLNDGVRPQIGEDDYLVCEFNSPREISTQMENEAALYQESGLAKAELIILI